MPKRVLNLVRLAQVSIIAVLLLAASAAFFLLLFPHSFDFDPLSIANQLGGWMVGLSIACLILLLLQASVKKGTKDRK
jgi:hypothetical protein